MSKNFDKWNNRKKKLHASEFRNYVHEREVWWCSLGVNIGVEADGKYDNFERPVLVLQKFSKEAVLVVALTSRMKENNPYYVSYIHKGATYTATISQIRIISTKRLLRKVFEMDKSNFIPILNSVLEMIKNKRPPR